MLGTLEKVLGNYLSWYLYLWVFPTMAQLTARLGAKVASVGLPSSLSAVIKSTLVR
jgi:hypothetical protein